MDALNKQLALAKQDVAGGDKGKAADVEKLNGQIEALQSEHQTRITDINAGGGAEADQQGDQVEAAIREQFRSSRRQRRRRRKSTNAGTGAVIEVDQQQIEAATSIADRTLAVAEESDRAQLGKPPDIDWLVGAESREAIEQWYETQRHVFAGGVGRYENMRAKALPNIRNW